MSCLISLILVCTLKITPPLFDVLLATKTEKDRNACWSHGLNSSFWQTFKPVQWFEGSNKDHDEQPVLSPFTSSAYNVCYARNGKRSYRQLSWSRAVLQ